MNAPLALSSSVQAAARALPSDRPVTAWEFVRAILGVHPEYGDKLGWRLRESSGPEGGPAHPSEAWLGAVRGLLDPDRAPELHGRMVILGLARLDDGVARHLDAVGFRQALQQELREPFDSLLREPTPAEPPAEESVPIAEAAPPASPEPNATVDPSQQAPLPTAPATPTEPGPPSVAGYVSDTIGGDATDRLDIGREVENIAFVLLSNRVRPPLSLGLFGDWGSGKSFFMTKLREQIARSVEHYRGEEARTGDSPEWCTRVVQIEFNAWHFSDTNLWASLVTRLYDALDDAIGPEEESYEEQRQKLEAAAEQAKGALHVAETQRVAAEARVQAASTTLQEARRLVAEKEQGLRALVGDVGELLRADPDTKAGLDRAADALGASQAARTYDGLKALRDDVGSLSGRAAAVVTVAARSPAMLLVLAALTVALPVLVALVLGRFGGALGEVGQVVGGVSSFVFGLVAWAGAQVRRGLGLVRNVEEAFEKAQARRQERIEAEPNVLKAQEEMAVAESAAEVARANLVHAQEELQRLQREVLELRPDRQLLRLITDRGEAKTYTQHLGLISLIRSDFERMSELFGLWAAAPRTADAPPPIQRIVLYIDDLDRCRPERVVEVLEAIHLLLAFPLFVVVVGVDPRWLRHSLSQHYPHTLSGDGRTTPGSAPPARAALPPFATPQDYLEKIFQIPFALRPVEREGYARLVADLLTPMSPAPLVRASGEPPAAGGDGASERIAADPTTGGDGAVGQGGMGGGHVVGSPAAGSPAAGPEPFRPLSPRQLAFTAWEQEDICRLWPLFRTPRTVKRFINTYRLLRAGLPPEATARFEGTRDAPGEYQVALPLLAVVTSATGEAAAFLDGLDAWLDTAPTVPPTGWSWAEVLDAVERAGGAPGAPLEILDELRSVTRDGFGRRCTRDEFQRWAQRVARYSFSVRPFQIRASAPVRSPTPSAAA